MIHPFQISTMQTRSSEYGIAYPCWVWNKSMLVNGVPRENDVDITLTGSKNLCICSSEIKFWITAKNGFELI